MLPFQQSARGAGEVTSSMEISEKIKVTCWLLVCWDWFTNIEFPPLQSAAIERLYVELALKKPETGIVHATPKIQEKGCTICGPIIEKLPTRTEGKVGLSDALCFQQSAFCCSTDWLFTAKLCPKLKDPFSKAVKGPNEFGYTTGVRNWSSHREVELIANKDSDAFTLSGKGYVNRQNSPKKQTREKILDAVGPVNVRFPTGIACDSPGKATQHSIKVVSSVKNESTVPKVS
jgi:hypothetical protein